MTPLRAIRFKCLECSAGQPKEVRKCPIENCALFPYRFGRNPNRLGIGRFNQRTNENPAVSRGILSKTGNLMDGQVKEHQEGGLG